MKKKGLWRASRDPCSTKREGAIESRWVCVFLSQRAPPYKVRTHAPRTTHWTPGLIWALRTAG